jgi:hypothetical protein
MFKVTCNPGCAASVATVLVSPPCFVCATPTP